MLWSAPKPVLDPSAVGKKYEVNHRPNIVHSCSGKPWTLATPKYREGDVGFTSTKQPSSLQLMPHFVGRQTSHSASYDNNYSNRPSRQCCRRIRGPFRTVSCVSKGRGRGEIRTQDITVFLHTCFLTTSGLAHAT